MNNQTEPKGFLTALKSWLTWMTVMLLTLLVVQLVWHITKSIFINGILATLHEIFVWFLTLLSILVFGGIGIFFLWLFWLLIMAYPGQPTNDSPWESNHSSNKTYIRSYYKKDGTHVRSHYRKK